MAVGAMTPSTTDTDIASYGATGLPPGLGIDSTTGAISGTPDTADANTADATVTVTDRAGNPATVSIAFPAVAKGDKTLTGFAYSPASVTHGDTAPTVTPPTGVQTTLSYSAAPEGVCTVDPSTGALTLVGVGECVITATAASSADYNQGTATYTVTVAAAGTLVLTPMGTLPAQSNNRFGHLRRHRPTMTVRRTRALHQALRAVLAIATEPFVARLAADAVVLAKRCYRQLATQTICDKNQLLLHATGLLPRHRPPPGPAITCHPSIRSILLPIYPVCTNDTHLPLPPPPRRRGNEGGAGAFSLSSPAGEERPPQGSG